MPNRQSSHRQPALRKKRPTDPAMRAGLIFLAPLLFFKMLTAFIPDWFVYLYIVIGLLYLFNGYLAGSFYVEIMRHNLANNHAKNLAVQKGAAAGLFLSILGWILFAALMITVQLFGVDVEFAVALFLGGLIDVVMALLLGALGGKLAVP